MPTLTKADYEALAAFRNALRRFVRFTEEGARAHGITPQQHQAMLAVKGQPGRDHATVSDLSEALQLKPHSTLELVNRCEAGGLLHREVDPDDSRKVRIAITAKGEHILETLSQQNLAELISLRAHLRLTNLLQE